MLQVTWEWLGMPPALDLANTVAITEGAEQDLVGSNEDFEEWARIESSFVPAPVGLLRLHRSELMEVRAAVRDLLAAVTAHEPPPRRAIETLNRLSRAAPEWTELDAASWRVVTRTGAGAA
ncbi:MAG TPA: ABATE domain-containing protein, partial [Actinomycetota bacterium]|nr:ABATE domain-containing protein [Actinomycetota bacterium]